MMYGVNLFHNTLEFVAKRHFVVSSHSWEILIVVNCIGKVKLIANVVCLDGYSHVFYLVINSRINRGISRQFVTV